MVRALTTLYRGSIRSVRAARQKYNSGLSNNSPPSRTYGGLSFVNWNIVSGLWMFWLAQAEKNAVSILQPPELPAID